MYIKRGKYGKGLAPTECSRRTEASRPLIKSTTYYSIEAEITFAITAEKGITKFLSSLHHNLMYFNTVWVGALK